MKLFKVTAEVNRKEVTATVSAESSKEARDIGIGAINSILITPLPWDEIVKIREC